jgi:hypothetical protein
MSPSKTKDEPKLRLPVGHPAAGYVEPDLSYHEGTGVLPPDELEFHEARNEAREDEVERVAEGEHEVAKREAEARERQTEQTRERLEKVASGEWTKEQAEAAGAAQAAVAANEDTSKSGTTTTKSSSSSSSS